MAAGFLLLQQVMRKNAALRQTASESHVKHMEVTERLYPVQPVGIKKIDNETLVITENQISATQQYDVRHQLWIGPR